MHAKKILLGITGSIAAYKAVWLVRQLIKAGAEVKVVMTPAAAQFVSPLVLSTLSKNKVMSAIADESEWNNHVALGRWADLMLIAPLSCNTLAKMAGGICDNLLLATYYSATAPVMVAPAMDEDMWQHPTTQRNLMQLQKDGVILLPVAAGELASGLVGEGRMLEPEEIVARVESFFYAQNDFKGKKVMITAGPTYEPLDPVRFIGNLSSGKMGYALATAFARRGAEVMLISGPVSLKINHPNITLMHVTTAEEMYETCVRYFEDADVAVMAAAVADYTPVQVATEKIKKETEQLTLQLKRTRDILAALGKLKKEGQLLVGFALETHNETNNALHKLQQKNADMIILNSLRDAGAGFGTETNKITIFDRWGNSRSYDCKPKEAVAEDIVDYIKSQIASHA